MKTPIQELIDKLYELSEMHASDMYKAGMRDAAIIAEMMLEKEKEVIMDAFISGDDSDCLQEQEAKMFAQVYYNETFNTKEK
jgi:hypothetical protein